MAHRESRSPAEWRSTTRHSSCIPSGTLHIRVVSYLLISQFNINDRKLVIVGKPLALASSPLSSMPPAPLAYYQRPPGRYATTPRRSIPLASHPFPAAPALAAIASHSAPLPPPTYDAMTPRSPNLCCPLTSNVLCLC